MVSGRPHDRSAELIVRPSGLLSGHSESSVLKHLPRYRKEKKDSPKMPVQNSLCEEVAEVFCTSSKHLVFGTACVTCDEAIWPFNARQSEERITRACLKALAVVV